MLDCAQAQDLPLAIGRFWDVLPTADSGFIAAGVAVQPFNAPYPPGYSQDAWVVKVDSMGCIVPGCSGVTGITAQVTNLGDVLNLSPNPLSLSKGNGAVARGHPSAGQLHNQRSAHAYGHQHGRQADAATATPPSPWERGRG